MRGGKCGIAQQWHSKLPLRPLPMQNSWSKGLKRSGLDDCHQVLEVHHRSTMSTFGTTTSYRAQSKTCGEESKENKDSKVTVAIL